MEKRQIHINIDENPLLLSDKDKQLAKELYDIVNKNRNSFFFILKRKENKHLLDWLNSKTPLLNDGSFQYNIGTKCYWLFNGLQDWPRCKTPSCNKQIGICVNCGIFGYLPHCNNKCKTKDPEVQAKIRKTCVKKYNCEWPSKSDVSKQHYQQTCEDKYGCKNVFASPKVISKIAKTIEQRYGNSNYRNTNKAVKTKIEKYGQGTNGKAISAVRKKFSKEKFKHIQQKIENTKEERYGDKNYNNSHKRVQTRFANNNGVYISKEQHEQMKQTYLKSCGYDHNFKNPEFRKMLQHKRRSTYLYDGKNFDSMPELAYYIYLKDNNIEFIYHPINLNLTYNINGVIHTYFPDFIVEGNLIELKGNQFFLDKDPTKRMISPYDRSKDKEAEIKHQYMLSIGVKIYTQEDYMCFINYVKTTYGNKYLLQFKVTSKK